MPDKQPDDYSRIPIPNGLAEQIDAIINVPANGYVSRADFVKDACRRLIEDMCKKVEART